MLLFHGADYNYWYITISRSSNETTRIQFHDKSWTVNISVECDQYVWYIQLKLKWYIIQIKICAEYRDMLPRPRLVCQEPGLRPIGQSPGVPDKSSRGLGSMSRYSAQILICFIEYIFLFFFHYSVDLVGNFAGLPVCTVPSAIVHCNQNEAGH